MKNGLIGEKLSHSYSPKIHDMIYKAIGQDKAYELFELQENQVAGFVCGLKKHDSCGINVTIPYKTKCMESLDYICEKASTIGAVNTIAIKENKLYGYNTDCIGFEEMLNHNFIDIKGKDFAVLGSGGSSKAIVYQLIISGAKSVSIYTRDPSRAKNTFNMDIDGYIFKSYDELDLDNVILVNTTPVGMYPNTDACPINPEKLNGCICVVDIIYNPTTTKLLEYAQQKGIQVINGFYMLVSQAVKAQEVWNDTTLDDSLTRHIYNTIKPDGKGNIVLIGMPGCGKTTIAKALANQLNMEYIDMDEYIEKNFDKIPKLFEQGEQHFRDIESKVSSIVSNSKNAVISTGGGVIKRKKNILNLCSGSTIYFVDRPLDLILNDIEHSTRPLLDGNKQSVIDLYNQRIKLYRTSCHKQVLNNKDIDSCVNNIIKDWKGNMI